MFDGTARGAGYGFSGGGVYAYVEIFATPKRVIERVGVDRVVIGSSHGGCRGGEIVRSGCHCLRGILGMGGGKLLILIGLLLIDVTLITCEWDCHHHPMLRMLRSIRSLNLSPWLKSSSTA